MPRSNVQHLNSVENTFLVITSGNECNSRGNSRHGRHRTYQWCNAHQEQPWGRELWRNSMKLTVWKLCKMHATRERRKKETCMEMWSELKASQPQHESTGKLMKVLQANQRLRRCFPPSEHCFLATIFGTIARTNGGKGGAKDEKERRCFRDT